MSTNKKKKKDENKSDELVANDSTSNKEAEKINEPKESNPNEAKEEITLNFKPKTDFDHLALNIYKIIGPFSNITDYTNCVTRLRLKLKTYTDSQIDELKKLDKVLNVIVASEQVQVVIGPNVPKLRSSFDKVINAAKMEQGSDSPLQTENNDANAPSLTEIAAKNKEKQKGKNTSKFQVFLSKFSQIFAPLIPAFIGAGLLAGIAGFIQVGVDNDLAGHPTANAWYEFLKLSLDVTLTVFIVVVGWRTAEIFGGSGAFGAVSAAIFAAPIGIEVAQVISLTYTEPIIISGSEGDSTIQVSITYSFLGIYDLNYTLEGTETGPVTSLYTWEIIDQPGFFANWMIRGFRPDVTSSTTTATGATIIYSAPSGQVFGALLIGYISVWVEKGIRSKMPGSIDLVVSSFLVMIILEIINFVAIIPIAGILFGITAWLFSTLLLIPLGIGAMILSGIFLIAVVFGVHQGFIPIYAALMASPDQNGLGVNALFPVLAMAGAGQVGAAIALWVKADKESILRKQISGAIIPGFLGIGEPLIYGVTLPRFKPFITACFGGAMGGLFLGFTNWLSIGIISDVWWVSTNAESYGYVVGLNTQFGPSGLLAIPFMTTGSVENSPGVWEASNHLGYAMSIYTLGLLIGYGSGFGFTYLFGTKNVDLT